MEGFQQTPVEVFEINLSNSYMFITNFNSSKKGFDEFKTTWFHLYLVHAIGQAFVSFFKQEVI